MYVYVYIYMYMYMYMCIYTMRTVLCKGKVREGTDFSEFLTVKACDVQVLLEYPLGACA